MKAFPCFSKIGFYFFSFKNFQKKWHFQTLATFVFNLKVALKPSFKIDPMKSFWFELSWKLYLTLPENGFSFVAEKLGKKAKMQFSNVQTFVSLLRVNTILFAKTFSMTFLLPRSALITMYKIFVRPNLDYGDILYDQAYNMSFH